MPVAGGRNARIRYIRKALALTQEEFAPILGVHRVTLAKLERGLEAGDEVGEKIDRYIAEYDASHRTDRRVQRKAVGQ